MSQERWTHYPLYLSLVKCLPLYVDNPFSPLPVLNVKKLHTEMNKSHEGVYKWLRAGKVSPRNAQAIVELANRQDNVDALTRLDRSPPRLEDFVPHFNVD